jgi:hypothetical protein
MGKNHDIPVGKHEVFSAQEIKKAVAASFEGHSKPHEPGLMNVFDRVSGDIGELDTIAKLGTYLKGIQEADPRFTGRAIKKAVAASFEGHGKPHEAGLLAVYDAVRGEVGELDTINKLGTYLKGIQEADPRFTGRAIKNITDAVKVRAMDFELPDEWMEQPDLFLFKTYDEKKAMIEDMRQPITVDMVVQEINRYADSEFRYADKSDEVAIENMVRDFGRNEEAKKRYLGKGE